MYELMYGAKHLLFLLNFLFHRMFHEKKSDTWVGQARGKTSLYSSEYFQFGRDKAPGDHVRFPNLLQLWFWLTIKRCDYCFTKKRFFTHSTLKTDYLFPVPQTSHIYNTAVPVRWAFRYFLLSLPPHVRAHRGNRMTLAQKTFLFHGGVLHMV